MFQNDTLSGLLTKAKAPLSAASLMLQLHNRLMASIEFVINLLGRRNKLRGTPYILPPALISGYSLA
jgi:hypothetical protein